MDFSGRWNQFSCKTIIANPLTSIDCGSEEKALCASNAHFLREELPVRAAHSQKDGSRMASTHSAHLGLPGGWLPEVLGI